MENHFESFRIFFGLGLIIHSIHFTLWLLITEATDSLEGVPRTDPTLQGPTRLEVVVHDKVAASFYLCRTGSTVQDEWWGWHRQAPGR